MNDIPDGLIEAKSNPDFDPDRFAVIADVHGNHDAFKAVLQDIPDDIDRIVSLGDLVGLGPHPKECVDTARDVVDEFVRGCHDTALDSPSSFEAEGMLKDTLWYARDELHLDDIAWLQTHPERLILNDQYLFCHYHPSLTTASNTYVYPRDYPSLLSFFDGHGVDLIALGHTHCAASRSFKEHVETEGEILNPGSVGFPFDRTPSASYGIIETDPFSVEVRRVQYDIEPVQEAILEADLPESLCRVLETADTGSL